MERGRFGGPSLFQIPGEVAALGGDGGADARRLLLARLAGVFDAIHARGGTAAAVGGAVRDTFLGRTALDIDVATSLAPDELLATFPQAKPTGLAFGTVTLLLGDATCHITTLRREGGYRDGRHPDVVAFGVSLEEDLARRDFTMNALALLPAGGIVDPAGGRRDIASRTIRAVGDPRQRFREDALRMLRAVRFESELCFVPDSAVEEALPLEAPLISRVHKERLWPELERLLGGPCAESAIRRGLPVLERVLPGIHPAPLADLGEDTVLRLCRLCAGVPPSDVEERLTAMAAGKARARRAARLLSLLAKPPGDEPHALRKAATAAGEEDLAALADLGGGTWARARALARQEGLPCRLAVSGSDIVAASGRAPGPWVGEMLSELWDVVWRDPLKNERNQLLGEVRSRLHPIGSDREG